MLSKWDAASRLAAESCSWLEGKEFGREPTAQALAPNEILSTRRAVSQSWHMPSVFLIQSMVNVCNFTIFRWDFKSAVFNCGKTWSQNVLWTVVSPAVLPPLVSVFCVLIGGGCNGLWLLYAFLVQCQARRIFLFLHFCSCFPVGGPSSPLLSLCPF